MKLNVGKSLNKVIHWWTERLPRNNDSSYIVQICFKISGKAGIQVGRDGWVSNDGRIGPNGYDPFCQDSNNCEEFVSNWLSGDTGGNFVTVNLNFRPAALSTIPSDIQFDNNWYAISGEGLMPSGKNYAFDSYFFVTHQNVDKGWFKEVVQDGQIFYQPLNYPINISSGIARFVTGGSPEGGWNDSLRWLIRLGRFDFPVNNNRITMSFNLTTGGQPIKARARCFRNGGDWSQYGTSGDVILYDGENNVVIDKCIGSDPNSYLQLEFGYPENEGKIFSISHMEISSSIP